jgi:hypothetical protein
MARGRPRKRTEDVLLKSAEMLGWALGGLEREIAATRERLANLTAQADALRAKLSRGVRGATSIGASIETDGSAAAGGTRRKMSAEARKRLSEMMSRRWAERRKEAGTDGSAAPVRKRKRLLSAEARKRISEAQKKRWAAYRKAAKNK